MTKNRIGGPLKYSAGIFTFLVAYSLTAVCGFSLPRVSASLYAFHVVDFGMGFCSKLLPGAVFSFFVREPSPAAASVFDAALLMLFFAGVAALLGKRLRDALQRPRDGELLLLFLFLTGPASFAIYASEPGFVDFYWLIFALLFLFFLSNKYLYLLILPLPALCILTHFSALLCAIPFFAVILLYKLTECGTKGEKTLLASVGALSLAAAAALFLYLLLNEKNNLVYSMSEFDAILKSRGAEVTSYFDYVFYGSGETVERVAESGYTPIDASGGGIIIKALAAVRNQIRWNAALLDKAGWQVLPGRIALLLLVSPLAALLLGFVFKGVGRNRSFLRKLAYITAGAAFFITLVFGMVFSTDYSRYVTLSVLPLFTFTLYAAFRERDAAAAYFGGVTARVPTLWRILYCAVYALTVIPPTDWV